MTQALWEAFKSRSRQEKQAAIMNVLAVSMADGEMVPAEYEVLEGVCRRVGLGRKELRAILAHPEQVKFVPPRDNHERLLQVLDMIMMMLSDGQAESRELAVIQRIAAALGFEQAKIQHLAAELATIGSLPAVPPPQVKATLQDLLQTPQA